MTILSWPPDLPQKFLIEGYSETPSENVLRSNMDVGPAKVRRRSTTAPVQMSGSMLMTIDQLKRFRQFYRSESFDGTVPFLFADITGTIRTVTIVQPPAESTVGNRVSVSLVFEYIP